MIRYISFTKAIRVGDYPNNPYEDGYGSKIPTNIQVKVEGRYQKVWAMNYGNSASYYIIRGRGKLFVNLEWPIPHA